MLSAGPIPHNSINLLIITADFVALYRFYWICSDPSYESDPSNEYSPLGLTHVMNSIFLDPSSEHWNPQTNSGLVLSCFKMRSQSKF